MALIDTFLQLMAERRAERLVLVADRVPFLLRDGQEIELSMPALNSGMIERIADEIGGGDSGDLQNADGAEFSYRIHSNEVELRIEIHPVSNAPIDLAENDELTRAVAAGFTGAAAGSGANVPPPLPVPLVAASPWAVADAAPASARVDPRLLAAISRALEVEASDIFLSSGKPPRIRCNGQISTVEGSVPNDEMILTMLPNSRLQGELAESGSVDFAITLEFSEGSRRIRVNVFRHFGGLAAALRPIRRAVPRISELGLPLGIERLVGFPHGLVLVTGAAGSGKSTTLAAWVDHLNRTSAKHIITIEDPIEFEHREIHCLIHQRELGAGVGSFGDGLRAALRESPDVILLGELRDLDTISAALTAAETGHLVLATLHTGSAAAAPARIIDVFPGQQQAQIRSQLALSLRAVVSQRLMPTRTGGLVPAIEKLLVNPAIANGIREGQENPIRNSMLTGADEGMITLERSLAALVRRGTIDLASALAEVPDPEGFRKLIG